MNNKVIARRDIIAFIRKEIATNKQSINDFNKETLQTMQMLIENKLQEDGFTVTSNTMDSLSISYKESLADLLYLNKFLTNPDRYNYILRNVVNIQKREVDSTKEEEYFGAVTYLSDQPNRKENEKKWMEWYNKLDEADHEILRERGEDPYDPWR